MAVVARAALPKLIVTAQALRGPTSPQRPPPHPPVRLRSSSAGAGQGPLTHALMSVTRASATGSARLTSRRYARAVALPPSARRGPCAP